MAEPAVSNSPVDHFEMTARYQAQKKASWQRVRCDRKADYAPIASTVTNLVDIVQKAMWDCNIIKHTPERTIYYSYLSTKSYAKCFVLAIPFLNIFVKVYDHFAHGKRLFNKALEAKRLNKPHEEVALLLEASHQGSMPARYELYLMNKNVEIAKDLIKNERVCQRQGMPTAKIFPSLYYDIGRKYLEEKQPEYARVNFAKVDKHATPEEQDFAQYILEVLKDDDKRTLQDFAAEFARVKEFQEELRPLISKISDPQYVYTMDQLKGTQQLLFKIADHILQESSQRNLLKDEQTQVRELIRTLKTYQGKIDYTFGSDGNFQNPHTDEERKEGAEIVGQFKAKIKLLEALLKPAEGLS